MLRNFLLAAAIFGFLGVGIGAFGAHSLRDTLEANGREDTFRTATQYHMYHALALIGVAWLSSKFPDNKQVRWSGIFFIAGILIFSGSLYILAIFDLGFMGAVAPIGGMSFLAGWACLGLVAYSINKET